MGGQKPEKTKKRICIGILAHVDAGKTTLSEGLLYLCGEIQLGRVDHGDAFLDTYELERERGITIFSKQARLKTEEMGSRFWILRAMCMVFLRKWSVPFRCLTMRYW